MHDGEGTEELVHPSNIAEFPYQQPYYDYTPSGSSSQGPGYAMPMMTHQHGACIGDEIDLHLGQKPKLGGRYANDSLIYISYFVGTLYIHVLLSFLYRSYSYFYFSKHKKTKNISVVSLCLPF
jgi:hypothetical protein